ncbi:MAG: malate synthase A [Motiliproteus sp.]
MSINQSKAECPSGEQFWVQEHLNEEYSSVLTAEALQFVEDLVVKFAAPLVKLMEQREQRQALFDRGELPDFLPETQSVRRSDWKIKGIPVVLQDRRVEMTGPVDRKMIINGLNANVKVFMADFEDSLAPTWDKVVRGQINLRDAVNGTIEHCDPGTGKRYDLNPEHALLLCRVRGLHLPEKHVRLGGRIVPGALLDFGLYFYHNHRKLLDSGRGPYFYLPKLQSHQEARWWSEVFHYAEDRFELEPGTIKATVLIETLPAVFEMDEILYEMRDHIVGLNCGRWDYIFSYIKTLREHPERVLPDREQLTMDQPFLSAYSRLLVRTCHRRGALAMGGMAAYIPVKDVALQAQVLAKVRQDKSREAANGHDGSWVAHPGLADQAMAVFDAELPAGKLNNLNFLSDNEAVISAADLLQPCPGQLSETGIRTNTRIAVQYLEAWISGNGCVPIDGLMEDAATAEICRTSIWQWIRHGRSLSNGKRVTKALFRDLLAEEVAGLRQTLGEVRWHGGRFDEAAQIMDQITTAEQLVEFLTLPSYEHL